ncbi:MAG: hypothetical protein SGILL_009828, partial [Bacillariaceae sp.]
MTSNNCAFTFGAKAGVAAAAHGDDINSSKPQPKFGDSPRSATHSGLDFGSAAVVIKKPTPTMQPFFTFQAIVPPATKGHTAQQQLPGFTFGAGPSDTTASTEKQPGFTFGSGNGSAFQPFAAASDPAAKEESPNKHTRASATLDVKPSPFGPVSGVKPPMFSFGAFGTAPSAAEAPTMQQPSFGFGSADMAAAKPPTATFGAFGTAPSAEAPTKQPPFGFGSAAMENDTKKQSCFTFATSTFKAANLFNVSSSQTCNHFYNMDHDSVNRFYEKLRDGVLTTNKRKLDDDTHYHPQDESAAIDSVNEDVSSSLRSMLCDVVSLDVNTATDEEIKQELTDWYERCTAEEILTRVATGKMKLWKQFLGELPGVRVGPNVDFDRVVESFPEFFAEGILKDNIDDFEAAYTRFEHYVNGALDVSFGIAVQSVFDTVHQLQAPPPGVNVIIDDNDTIETPEVPGESQRSPTLGSKES